MGGLGAGAVILAGKDILSNALSMGGAAVGYQLAGEEGAYVGGFAGAAGGRRINIGSGSNGGSMTMTQERERVPVGRGRPIVPPRTGPATSIGRLANALQNVQPDTRPPVQQQIRESQYLRNVEEEIGQAARSDLSLVQRSKRKPKEPSMLSKVSDSIKSAYRRLSGGGESDKGTYAILPTEEPQTKTRTLGVSVDAPKSWPAMEKAKVRNEKIIRESIERTNQAEIAKALKQGIIVPEELVAKAKIDFSKALIDNRKKSANELQRVFRGHLARNEYHELDKRRVNATSNFAQLSKAVLKQSNLDATDDECVNPQTQLPVAGCPPPYTF